MSFLQGVLATLAVLAIINVLAYYMGLKWSREYHRQLDEELTALSEEMGEVEFREAQPQPALTEKNGKANEIRIQRRKQAAESRD